ncbi:MAG: 16S rRNA (adenine(1518)-N(6)/adenine(1519)-N(6))-dimethyltransferase RsmA [Bacteroidales bacterium]|jgi:16S rRNA (adenine1518-N6/adenine1519-N6)-dimethyltransferase|nr:16S rRNA (adenine(1518)-N(6)/adenine(1519)-N(6))-dimethyltransferase RsmA [Bacteroidales bacterium]
MAYDKGVRAKKFLGQHFLHDKTIAERIAESVIGNDKKMPVLEVGPGTGILSCYLWQRQDLDVKMVELDSESVQFLLKNYPDKTSDGRLIEGDFLHLPLTVFFNEPFIIAGNFPYNISSQILFKTFENKDTVTQVTGMFQKEVAERIAAKPCSKTYGILSVLLQAYYNIEYLFTVPPGAFTPPPKVQSGVIRLIRNEREKLPFPDKTFVTVVKTAFNQRRKTLSNALKPLTQKEKVPGRFASKRAEELSVEDFTDLTEWIASLRSQ